MMFSKSTGSVNMAVLCGMNLPTKAITGRPLSVHICSSSSGKCIAETWTYPQMPLLVDFLVYKYVFT